jgi:ABC-2 type transport system permease protein
MRNTLTIAKREFGSFFNSAIPYVLVAGFVVLSGVFYFRDLFLSRQADLRHFFELMPLLFCILVPMLTMRLIAEERREGTLELLLTMPVSDWQLVSGKFLAALGVMCVMLGLTLSFPITVAYLGPLDKGTATAGYLGALLMAGAFSAIGVMASSLTRNQMLAAVISFIIGFVLLACGMLAGVSGPTLGPILSALGIGTHFNNIAHGVIDSRDVLYYLSIIFGCLLVAQQSLDSRRWR